MKVAQREHPSDGVDGAIASLFEYCRQCDWAGFDPYDALNSGLFERTPFAANRVCRIVLTQLMKRLPLNIRPLLGVPQSHNPKGIALFLMAFVKLSRLGALDQKDLVDVMAEKLVGLRSQDTPYWCWGYSFPWQTRTMMVPRGAPNLVCTSFAANALLDAYELQGDRRHLDMAIGAAEYILKELYWTERDGTAGFSYPLPASRDGVHNANFLGAALLCRVHRSCGEVKFREAALQVARYSAARQKDDGSWSYGELPTQRWIDNFHTGYNLCALRSIGQSAETLEFEPHIRRGVEFYNGHFFREDGAPRYFHDRTYPIDIHCVAQSIMTLLTLRDVNEANVRLARSVFRWAMAHMWDERGRFYYQVLRFGTIRISYMRWSQAWMLLALSTLAEHRDKTAKATETLKDNERVA